MKIAIDLDGVLADFLPRMYVITNAIWPGKVPEKYVPYDWDHSDILTQDETKIIFDKIHDIPNFWLSIRPFFEAVKALRRFLYTYPEIEVYYITARAPAVGQSLLAQCYQWLDEHGLIESNTSVIPTKSGKDKWRIIKTLGIDFSIDDAAKTISYTMAQAQDTHKAFLLTQSWNQNDKPDFTDGSKPFNRVNSMQEFLDIVAEAYRGQTQN